MSAEEAIAEKPTRVRKLKHVFTDPSGNLVSLKDVNKLFRDILIYHHGIQPYGEKATCTVIDPRAPLLPVGELEARTELLLPGKDSPLCRKCKLDDLGARHPYFEPIGPDQPLITIVLDSVSAKEDARGELASDGSAAFITKLVNDLAKETGVSCEVIRWSPTSRCASRGKKPNYKAHGNWCKAHLVQDILAHPPRILVPIGSVALGLLCHKSNAQDWGGRMLTYRGWPDDWLQNPTYMLPRPDPTDPENRTVIGHPLFGAPPNIRIPMFPLQSPRIVYGTQNPQVILRWKKQFRKMLEYAVNGVQPLNFDRPWYFITEDPDEVAERLQELIDNPGTIVSFDTETNGLKPWNPGITIVFMMFRWTDKDGNPRSLGFPWDYPESPMKPYMEALTPYVLEALYVSENAGHNIAFDSLFSIANIEGCDLDKLAPRMKWDTWHMIYTMSQQRGTISLDMVAYNWAPDLAGYEEDMTLLIGLHKETMHPDSGPHAHYANCPREKWPTHLRPYVMGDVEVVHVAREKVIEKLKACKVYHIPLAHPTERGRFRRFQAQSRWNVYTNVVSPANRMLIKMMGRGMQVDVVELERQEALFPKQLREMKEKLRNADPRIVDWCLQREQTVPNWELDLEKPDMLRELLFDILGLPVQMMTDAGMKIYKNDIEAASKEDLIKYAKVDKFTLNKIAVTYPNIRPLQEYRKAFKAYSSYVRPIRNAFLEGFDKKRREKDAHLARDGRVHAQFLLTGTRSGRLASRDPNLQQLPRDSVIKRIYCSRFGTEGLLYQGDLSQIELRLIAAACGDKAMVDAYWQDIDLHSLSMSRIFKLPYDHCIKDHVMWLQKNGKDKEAKDMELKRKIAKTINFLTGYGGGAYGLQATLANDSIYYQIEECESFLEAFFDSYPALRQYLQQYKRFIQDNGVAVSILGRVRVFEDVYSDNQEFVNKALRAGCNHLIQATASDMMLICLCVIEELMRQDNLESMLVSTVHDSLVIDAKRSELQQVHEIVYGVFNNIPEVMRLWFGPEADLSWLIVPFGGDCEIGFNYLDTKKIPNKEEIDWDAVCADLKKVA